MASTFLSLPASSGGSGDFLANGTVPMTGHLQMGGKSILNIGNIEGADGNQINIAADSEGNIYFQIDNTRIDLVGPTTLVGGQVTLGSAANVVPATNNARDLGTDALEFKDLWVHSVKHNDASNPHLALSTTGNNGNISLGAHGTGKIILFKSGSASVIGDVWTATGVVGEGYWSPGPVWRRYIINYTDVIADAGTIAIPVAAAHHIDASFTRVITAFAAPLGANYNLAVKADTATFLNTDPSQVGDVAGGAGGPTPAAATLDINCVFTLDVDVIANLTQGQVEVWVKISAIPATSSTALP